jgi:hypothetical protein
MSASLLSVLVNFTPLYSNNARSIHINPNWTIKQMYESIAPIVKQIFQIDEFILIENKNNSHTTDFPKEAQIHIHKSNTSYTKVKEIWSDNLNVSFLIKDLNAVYPDLDNKS